MCKCQINASNEAIIESTSLIGPTSAYLHRHGEFMALLRPQQHTDVFVWANGMSGSALNALTSSWSGYDAQCVRSVF